MSQINRSIRRTKPHHVLRTTLIVLSAVAFQVATAHATVFEYNAFLDGPSEFPPNASPGTGFADVFYDDAAHTLKLDITFSDLLGPTTASHIHAATASPGSGTAGVATTTPTFAGFPLGVTSGSYLNTLDLTLASSYNPPYMAANGGTPASAEAALIAAINADEAYVNIHTSVVSGGEIRGFLVAVPEPSSMILTGLGVVALAWTARRRSRS
jgi:CHRD domain/PEP-CTERM motif